MVENRRYTFLWMLIGAGVFIILAALSLVYLNQPSTSMATQTPVYEQQVKRVSIEEAKAAFDTGTAVFVDVRDSGSYETSHIPGALLIPLSDLTNHLLELDRSSWIITYCT